MSYEQICSLTYHRAMRNAENLIFIQNYYQSIFKFSLLSQFCFLSPIPNSVANPGSGNAFSYYLSQFSWCFCNIDTFSKDDSWLFYGFLSSLSDY
jgi:hypothetical protein